MMDPVENTELLAFTRTIDAKSLTRAAAELGIPRATVGKRLARLEERLGVRLVRRTTRSLVLTDAGEVFYRHARIVLDAYPKIAIPAKVSFIANEAQFTPKTVETQSERDTLMFRVRVKIDPERLRARAESVRSGLPGLAYVLTDTSAKWPAPLQGNAVR